MRNRNDLSQMTDQEKQIVDTIRAVEALPIPNTELTNCVIALQKAKDHLGNFVDGIEPATATTDLTFGQATEAAKQGKRVARQGWNGKGMYLQLQVVDEHSKMQHNYLYMSDVNGKFFPWNPNNLDILAKDWMLVDEATKPKEETFMDRLIKERDELKEKLDKLKSFLDKGHDEVAHIVGDSQADLLSKQFSHMLDYFLVLDKRITDLIQ